MQFLLQKKEGCSFSKFLLANFQKKFCITIWQRYYACFHILARPNSKIRTLKLVGCLLIPVTGAGTSRVRPSPVGRPHGRPIDRWVRTTPVPAPITLVTSQKFVAGQLVAAGRGPENKYVLTEQCMYFYFYCNFLFRQMASTHITYFKIKTCTSLDEVLYEVLGIL